MLLDNFIRLSCLSLTVYKLMRCLKTMPHDFLIALAFQRRVRLTFVCRLSALWLTNSFHAEAPPGGELRGWGWGWGWGTLNKVLCREFLPPVQPLAFHILFPTEKGTPFVYSRTAINDHLSFFGEQSVHRRFFKPLSNCHLSTTTTFFRLKVAVVES